MLGLLLLTLYAVLGAVSRNLKKTSRADFAAASPKLGDKNYVNYYEPNYAADIFADEDYLAKDRVVRYTYGDDLTRITVVLDELSDEEMTEGGRFFKKYVDIVTHGESDAYKTLFTPEYAANPNGFEAHPDRTFPMQRLYDVHVTELARTDADDPTYTYHKETAVFGVYEVTYKILKNDGEFRVDLAENGEIPLIFELVTTNVGTPEETTRIRDIYRTSDIALRARDQQ